jgi:hypothetical protein
MLEKMNKARIDLRKKILFINPLSKTTTGVFVSEGDPVTLAEGCPKKLKGEAAIDALQRSRESVPHPKNWKAFGASRRAAAGVKSWRSYVRGTRCLLLEVEGDLLKILPSDNLGAREGIQARPEDAIVLAYPSTPEEVGEAIERAFGLCT